MTYRYCVDWDIKPYSTGPVIQLHAVFLFKLPIEIIYKLVLMNSLPCLAVLVILSAAMSNSFRFWSTNFSQMEGNVICQTYEIGQQFTFLVLCVDLGIPRNSWLSATAACPAMFNGTRKADRETVWIGEKKIRRLCSWKLQENLSILWTLHHCFWCVDK